MDSIPNFDDVILPEGRVLLALDIDETTMYFPEIPHDYWEIEITARVQQGHSFEEASQLVLKQFTEHINSNLPHPTDFDGLHRLLQRADKTVFITARPSNDNHHTRRHLDHLNVPSTIPIYNSGGFNEGNKGLILKKIVEEENVDYVVFVEDTEKHLESVREAFADSKIECRLYKFKRAL